MPEAQWPGRSASQPAAISDVATHTRHERPVCSHFPRESAWHTQCSEANEPIEDKLMAKSTSIAELHAEAPVRHGESKPRKPASATWARQAKTVTDELSGLPAKPLLIGAGIGVALLGSAWAVSSRGRLPAGSPFTGMNRTLTRTALVALARVVSGQTVRSVAASALLDVASALKTR